MKSSTKLPPGLINPPGQRPFVLGFFLFFFSFTKRFHRPLRKKLPEVALRSWSGGGVFSGVNRTRLAETFHESE